MSVTGRETPARRADPTRRFSSRVDDYVRHRPGYPDALVGLLWERIGLRPEWRIADVGCGTGLSALPFLRAGAAVVGVEPNREMRLAGARALRDRRGFRPTAGRAEALPLRTGSLDLLVAGQAFHWFDVRKAAREFARCLRAGGWAAVFWNTRRRDGGAFLRGYEELLQRHGTDYARVHHQRDREEKLAGFFGPGWRRHALPNEQVLDREGLRGRLLSSSYTPEADDPARAPMLEALDELFRAHARGGEVRLLYDLEVFVGRPGEPARP